MLNLAYNQGNSLRLNFPSPCSRPPRPPPPQQSHLSGAASTLTRQIHPPRLATHNYAQAVCNTVETMEPMTILPMPGRRGAQHVSLLRLQPASLCSPSSVTGAGAGVAGDASRAVGEHNSRPQPPAGSSIGAWAHMDLTPQVSCGWNKIGCHLTRFPILILHDRLIDLCSVTLDVAGLWVWFSYRLTAYSFQTAMLYVKPDQSIAHEPHHPSV